MQRTLGPRDEYQTRLLRPPDLGDLQALFERARDYFETATGTPPTADEAERAFVGGPPTRSVNDKRTIGVFDRGGTLVGVLDAIPGFPHPSASTMGLLLIDPSCRGRGVGSMVLAAYEEWLTQQGITEFRTAVVAHHRPGVRFLERAGYRPESRTDGPTSLGSTPVVSLSKVVLPTS